MEWHTFGILSVVILYKIWLLFLILAVSYENF